MQQLRLSGTGGQGLILGGIILAEAALEEGKLAVQSQSYGPEARGGSSKSEVIISDKAIRYPKITAPDVLLAMSEEACKKYSADLPEEGILVTDSMLVHKLPDRKFKKVYELPITQTAQDKLGRSLFANIVALGAIAKITGVVSIESLIKVILARVPKGTEEMNEQAIRLGMALVD
jgi:2-oxoglutarate ferredoxin oxidoreductase subunit gamma